MRATVIGNEKAWNKSLLKLLTGLLLGMILGGSLTSCSRDPKVLQARYEKKGTLALSQGKASEAIIDFENLVKLAPRSSRAHDLLARAFRKKGWFADAVTQEEEAVRVDPRFVPGLLFLARYGYRTGQLGASLSQAQKVLAIDPKNVPARVLSIRMTLFAPVANHDRARKELEALAASHPQSLPTLLALGDLDLLERRIPDARLRYQSARTLSPTSPDPFVGLGNCALADGRIPEARDDFGKAWDLSGHAISYAIVLANFEVQRGHVKKAIALLKDLSKEHLDARVPMKIGEYELLLGQTASARRELEPLAQAHIDIPELHADLATADLQDHKEQAAYDELSDVLAKVPGNVRVRTVMARIQESEGHPDKALDLLRPLVNSPSLPPETWILWARLDGQKKHLHSALEKIARGIGENPGSRLLKIERMQILAAMKQWRDGLSESDAFLREFPRDRTGILEKAFFLERLHRNAEARGILREALANTPSDSSLELADLRIMASTGTAAEIRKQAEAFLAANPKDLPVRLWLADFEARRNHKKRAQALWTEVRAIDPANLPASVSLARTALAGQNSARALTVLGPALSSHPEVEVLHVLSGAALEGMRQPGKAAEEFAAALRLVPGDVRAQWGLAKLDLGLNRQEEARSLLAVLRKTPGLAPSFRARVQVLSGFLAVRGGHLAQGKKALREAVRLDPGNPSYFVSLGGLEETLGDGKKAVEAYAKALRLDPKNIRVRILRDRVLLGLLKNPSPEKAATLKKETRDFEANHPGSSLALQTLFDLSLFSRDLAEARKELNDLEKISPDSPGTLEDKARLALATNRPEEAWTLFLKATEKNPENLGTLRALAGLAAIRNDLKGEKLWLSRILSENPGDPSAGLSLASLAIVGREYAQARSVLESILSRYPDLPKAEVLLAQAELGTDEPGRARMRLSRLIKRFPADGSLYLLRAETEERTGQKQKAVSDYRTTIRLLPKNPVAYNNLAFLLATEGQELPEALRLVRKSRALADTPVAMDTQGLILTHMGQYSEAEKVFSRARARKDDDPEFLLHMAENEERMGDFSNALRHGREALRAPSLSGLRRLGVEEEIRRIEANQEKAKKNTLAIRP